MGVSIQPDLGQVLNYQPVAARSAGPAKRPSGALCTRPLERELKIAPAQVEPKFSISHLQNPVIRGAAKAPPAGGSSAPQEDAATAVFRPCRRPSRSSGYASESRLH